MSRCFYRFSGTLDPEERLEDAALAKALHDALGQDLKLLDPKAAFPNDGLHLGRLRPNEPVRNPLSPGWIPYWEDPAFISATRRTWSHEDLPGAGRAVAALHAAGRDALVKLTRKTKDLIIPVPRGQSLRDALETLVYSVSDQPPCMLVQEKVEMRFERRFLFLDGELLTQSAVGVHLTPMSRAWEAGRGVNFEDLHLATPTSRRLIHNPALTARMTDRACEIAAVSGYRTFCMDLCLIGDDATRGHIEAIEWNPLQPGQIGLYGCDPRCIALGVQRHLEEYPDFYRGIPAGLETLHGMDADWTDFDA